MPNEKKSAWRAISSAVSAARGTSIIVPMVGRTRGSREFGAHLGDDLLGERPEALELPRVGHERNHDLGLDLDSILRDAAGGLGDRAHLHRVDLGEGDAEPAAAMAQHRIELVQALELVANVADRAPEGRGDGLDVFVRMRQELVERRIEQPHRDGQPVHRAEDPLEVPALHRQQLRERDLARRRIRREDHLAHGQDPPRLEEHVLRPAEADALGAEAPGDLGVLRRVGVGPDRSLRTLSVHSISSREGPAELRHDRRRATEHDLPRRAVDRDASRPRARRARRSRIVACA